MTRTARRWLPAVAVLASLGIAWTTASLLDSTSAAHGEVAGVLRPAVKATTTTTAAKAKPTTTIAAKPAVAVEKPATRAQAATTTTAAPQAEEHKPVESVAPTPPLPPVPPAPLPPHGDVVAPGPCDGPSGRYRPATEADFRKAVAKVWTLCGDGPSFFGTSEQGLEIRPDGRWAKIEHVRGDTYRRQSGWENEGSWSVVDTSLVNGGPTFQINFSHGDNRETFTTPVFAGDASTVRLDNNGFFVADYHVAPAGTTVLPATGTANGCEGPETAYAPATEAEFRAAVTRAWLLCEEPSFFGTDEAGLEIRADGRWSKLQWTPNGALVRLEGWGNEGSWETKDISAMNGRPLFQLSFQVDGGGWIGSIPALAGQRSKVAKMRIDNMGTHVGDYVPVAPSIAVTGP